MKNTTLQHAPLGQPTVYASSYDAALLCAIPRSAQRDALGINGRSFFGADIWRAYEVSWLNRSGMPQVAMGQCVVPGDSAMLIESKSMKLYLNALNQSKFSSKEALVSVISKDFSICAQAPVAWQWLTDSNVSTTMLEGICLDVLPVTVDGYDVCADHLKANASDTLEEQVYSHLFRSNCLVTGQPDWASVHIAYQGHAIDHAGLLKYLISYRLHQAFHEHCVERIWHDIDQCCKPDSLTVRAYFTRRGGIDINPVRSSHPISGDSCLRLPRQ